MQKIKRSIGSVLFLSVSLILIQTCAKKDGAEDILFQDLSVWTVTETFRVLRRDLPGQSAAVNLSAARNEWESFQILLRSKSQINDLTIEPGDLSGPEGAIIFAAEAFLYRQHQFYLENPSWGVTEFQPGWYPDPLIPFFHPLTREPLTDPEKLLAIPFTLVPDETHGFLVDLYAPPGKPAGVYQGTYTVKAEETPVFTIPVSLTIWDFTLPDEPTLKTNFGSPEQQMRHLAWLEDKNYSEAYWTGVSDQCNELVSRHGLNPVMKAYALYFEVDQLESDGSFELSIPDMTLIQDFINQQRVNAIRLPFRGTPTINEVVFGNRYYDENSFDHTQFTASSKNRLVNYVASWDKVVTQLSGKDQILFYVYLCDEPNTFEAYQYVRALGNALRTAALEHIKVLVVEQTIPDAQTWGDLYGAVDIWVPHFTLFDPANAAQRQSLNEQIWTYTALTEWGGGLSWQTDLPLLNYRIPTWISWRSNISGLLYWSMAYWWSLAYPDPWNQPQTYLNEWLGQKYYYNGEGVLVYPADKVGYHGIAPSLRLKALRDGIEDFEYLAIIQRLGLSEQALKIVEPLARTFSSFETDPVRYEQARAELAALIVQASQ
ncbi:glycoside hydrolase domain-containing protein [candidate division CSSED10-310 bacterium]|uniref:Glycoside hydrolase domain-containing protein n=1 Tax=candidate division CSSED10-310 bacterium TaxID=2855610 RepID=A0ABV6Z0Q6_UNCC1